MQILSVDNLPQPNEAIYNFVYDNFNNLPLGSGDSYKQSLTDIYGKTEKLALCNTVTDNILDKLVIQQYQEYFQVPILSCYVSLKTVNRIKGKTCLPPHIHYVRNTALNYFFDLGGTNVKTCYYKHKITDWKPREKWGGYYLRDDVIPHNYMIAEKNVWYAYSTLIPHSVEGIEKTRIFLAIMFDDTYEMADLVLEPKLKFSNVTLHTI